MAKGYNGYVHDSRGNNSIDYVFVLDLHSLGRFCPNFGPSWKWNEWKLIFWTYLRCSHHHPCSSGICLSFCELWQKNYCDLFTHECLSSQSYDCIWLPGESSLSRKNAHETYNLCKFVVRNWFVSDWVVVLELLLNRFLHRTLTELGIIQMERNGNLSMDFGGGLWMRIRTIYFRNSRKQFKKLIWYEMKF